MPLKKMDTLSLVDKYDGPKQVHYLQVSLELKETITWMKFNPSDSINFKCHASSRMITAFQFIFTLPFFATYL